jgi:citronellol/citronellal dehydrogenase
MTPSRERRCSSPEDRGHRPRDRDPRGARWGQCRRRRQDGRASSEALGDDPHRREEIEKAGGKALPIQLDVRDDAAIAAAIEQTVKTFGGLDILVNNASAISLTPTLATPARRFDLMMTVNARATFLCSQAAIAHLKKSKNAHILTLSPPLAMKAKWFAGHVAYTMSKYGMSMCTLGMAEEFKGDGIAVNSLWPRTTIATGRGGSALSPRRSSRRAAPRRSWPMPRT